ncbi:MAG: DUF1116 domain-containing protein [Burkholderiales bacterium]|nr:DUF1116 domain-containing protein [Burkholderiales bacterium]
MSHLLKDELAVVNVGIEAFVESVRLQGKSVWHVEWQPPGDGQAGLAWQLAQLLGDPADPESAGSRIDRANDTATARMLAAQPRLVDVALHAHEVWPDMDRMLLHAGAPVPWERMCPPMRGAMIGAALYERWAASPEEAEALLGRGEIRFAQCHDRNAVGPMSGVISQSMPLFVVKNGTHGNTAYSNFSEGIGRVLRFGAYSPQVLEQLRWIENVLAPAVKAAVARAHDGIDLKTIQSQALLMGDEVHSRNAAATALFFMSVAPALAASDFDRAGVAAALAFIAANSQFFLNLSMAASKATMDAAHGVEHSSIVTAIARNGVTTAIRVSGLGKRWFEAPSDTPVGLYFPGFKAADANPDLGDSAICETAGFGGLSLAASPALVKLVGGTVAQAIGYSREMAHVAWTRNPAMSLPNLEFAGAPAGIDVRKVVDTGIRPVLTTGIAHREAGIGQIGAGIVRAPLGCFTQALAALAESLGIP